MFKIALFLSHTLSHTSCSPSYCFCSSCSPSLTHFRSCFCCHPHFCSCSLFLAGARSFHRMSLSRTHTYPILHPLQRTQTYTLQSVGLFRHNTWLFKKTLHSIKRALYSFKRPLYFFKRALQSIKRAL